jgi:hypothetical protein
VEFWARPKCRTIGFSNSFSVNNDEGEFRRFDELSHQDEYILDLNLVIGYQTNDIPGWNSYVNSHLRLGKRLYLLPQVIPELEAGIPKGFEVLDIEDPKDDYQLNRVFEKIANEFCLKGETRRAKIDIQLIAYAGFAAASAVRQLSDEAVLGCF